MPDQITPVEAVIPNQPTPEPKKEEPGFLDKGGGLMNAITSVGNFFQPVVEPAKNVVSTVATGKVFDVFDWFDDNALQSFKPATFSNKEQERINEAKDLHSSWAFSYTSDLLWGLADAWKNLLWMNGLNFKSSSFFTNDTSALNNKVSSFDKARQEKEKKISDIATNPEYKALSDFESMAYQSYLESKGITNISDINEFNEFKAWYFQSLPAIQKNQIMETQRKFQENISSVEKEIQDIDSQKKKYLSETLEWGSDEYDKYVNSQQEDFKKNKLFSFNQKIYSDVTEEVNDSIIKSNPNLANFQSRYQDNIDSLIDDKVNNKLFLYDIMANGGEDAEKLAWKWKEISEIDERFKSNILTEAAKLKADPQYKTLSDIDLKKKAQANVYNSLSESDLKLLNSKESFVANTQLAHQKWRVGKGVYDTVMWSVWVLSTWVSNFFDQVYDIERDGVPYRIAQETRNIMYAGEWWIKQIGSIANYEQDTILGMVLATKWVGWAMTKTESLLGKVLQPNGFMKIPIQIAGKAVDLPIAGKVLSTSGKLAKYATTTAVEWAAWDPILDIALQQAPSKLIDDVNSFTNLAFDTSLYSIGKWVKWGYTSGNRLLYEFIEDPANKEIHKNISDLAKKQWITMDVQQAKKFLYSAAETFQMATSKQDVTDIFTKPGAMWKMVFEHLDELDKAWAKEELQKVLTSSGIGISRMIGYTGIPKPEIDNLVELFTYKDIATLSPEKKALVNATISKQLDKLDILGKGGSIDNIIIKNNKIDDLYVSTINEIRNNVAILRMALPKPVENIEVIRKAFDIISESKILLQSKYTSREFSPMIKLTQFVPAKNGEHFEQKVITISEKDLRASIDEGASFVDLMKQGKFKIHHDGEEKIVSVLSGKADNASAYSRKFIDRYVNDLKEYLSDPEISHLLDQSNWIPLDSLKKTVENILHWSRGTINLPLSGKVKTIEDGLKATEKFIPILKKIVSDFYGQYQWKDVVSSYQKINGIDGATKADGKVDQDKIIKHANNHGGIINIYYWSYIGENFTTKESSVISGTYITFWKDFPQRDIISSKLDGKYQTNKEYGNLGNYTATTSSIKNKIIEYGLKNGKFDFESGLNAAMAIDSINYEKSFIKDWAINKQVILDILNSYGHSIDPIKNDIVESVALIFDWAIDSQDKFLKPMILTFIGKYIQNKKLIDDFFQRVFDGKIAFDDKVKAISHLLLNDNISAISKAKNNFNEFKPILQELSHNIDKEFTVSKNRIIWEIDLMQNQIDSLKKIKIYSPDQKIKDDIIDEMNLLEKKKSALSSSLASLENKQWANTLEIVRGMVDNYMVATAKKFSANFMSTIKSKQIDIGNLEKINIARYSSEDKKYLMSVLTKTKEFYSNGDINGIHDYFTGIISSDVSDKIKAYVENMYNKFVLQDGITVDTFNYTKLIHSLRNAEATYAKEYIQSKDTNPILKKITAFINNSSTGQDENLNKNIRKYFWFDENQQVNLVDMYFDKENTSVKEFIDSLHVDNNNIDTLSKDFIREKVSSFIRWVYTDSIKVMDDSWNTVDWFDDALQYAIGQRTFIDRIKRIQWFIQDDRIIDIVKKKKEIKFNPDGTMMKFRYSEVPLIIKNLLNKWVDIVTIQGLDEKDFKQFYFQNKDSANPMWEFARMFNNETPKKRKEIGLTLWYKDLSDYIFVWNYGDKTSAFTFYKPRKFLGVDKMTPEQKLTMYRQEYTFANGLTIWDYSFKDLMVDIKKMKDDPEVIADYKKSISDAKKILSDTTLKEKNEIVYSNAEYIASRNFLDFIIEKINEAKKFMLDNGKVRKREAPMMSTFHTFDWVVQPVKLLQLKLVSESYHINSKELASETKNMQDGSAFVSPSLIQLRDKIRWLKNSYEFKDHLFGDIDWKKVLGKALFSKSSFKKQGKNIDGHIVAMDEDSLKINYPLQKLPPEKQYEITINGKKYIVEWEADIDTSFFKNASSDTFKHEEEVTGSLSVNVKLPVDLQLQMNSVLSKKIQGVIDTYFGSLADFRIKSDSYNDMISDLTRTVSNLWIWMYNGSTMNDKLKMAIDEINSIIQKPTEAWQEIFIKMSNDAIGLNELVVSVDSDIWKQAVEKNNFDVVNYRYPVPSLYNLWVYRLVANTDPRFKNIPEFQENFGPKQVVAHPRTTYKKLEADHDGDHMYLLNTSNDIGKFYATSVLRLATNNDTLSIDEATRLIKDQAFDNVFIEVAQIEKWSGMKKYSGKSFLQSRNTALIAKQSVGTVAATNRTFFILDNIFKTLSENTENPIGLQKTGIKDYKTLKDLYDTFGDAWKNARRWNNNFEIEAANSLQMAVDFWSKDADKFPEDWIYKLGDTMGFDMESIKSVITPLSQWFWRIFDIKDQWGVYWFISKQISGLADTKDKAMDILYQKFKDDWYTQQRINKLFSKFWNKDSKISGTHIGFTKSLIEDSFILNPKFLENISIIWNNIDPVIVRKMIEKTQSSKKILDILDNVWFNSKSWYFNKTQKINEKIAMGDALAEKLRSAFPKLSQSFNEIDRIYLNGWGVDKKTKKPIPLEWEVKFSAIKDFIKELPLWLEERFATMFYAASRGETNSYNFLGDLLKLDFLVTNDTEYRKIIMDIVNELDLPDVIKKLQDNNAYDLINKKFWFEINPQKIIEQDKIISQLKENIVQTTKDLSAIEESWEDNASIILRLQAQKDEIESVIDTLEKTDISNLPDPIFNEKIEHQFYDLPEVELRGIVISDRWKEESLQEMTWLVQTQIDWWKVTMDKLYSAFAPGIKLADTDIRSYLNALTVEWTGIKLMDEVSRYNTREFSDTILGVGKKNSIFRYIKKLWLTKDGQTNLIRKIQKEFLTYNEWRYIPTDIDVIKSKLSTLFSEMSLTNLTANDDFMKQVIDYNTAVTGHVAKALNDITKMGYDVHWSYKKIDFSLMTDVIEATKGDLQFATKLNGIGSKDDFFSYVDKEAKAVGKEVSSFTKAAMANLIFRTTPWVLENILSFFQALHYELSYGWLASVLHQGNIVAGLAQIVPNLIELQAFRARNWKDMEAALRIANNFDILNFESTIRFGTGHWKNISESALSKVLWELTEQTWKWAATWLDKVLWIVTKANNKISPFKINLWVSKESQIKSWELLDSFVNNALGFNDWPLENMRKLTAILEQMDTLGIKDYDDFLKKYDQFWDTFVLAFNNRVRTNFTNSGGGAVSSSPISRATIFENAHAYFDSALIRFFMQANSYLMGWAFHKAATLVEKEMSMFSAIGRLKAWDIQWFKAHIHDFVSYNNMLARQMIYTAWLYLKFQKFEDNPEDKVDFTSFAKSFSNTLVSLEILLWRHIDAYSTASEYEWTIGDKIWFTAISLYEKMMRLFKQPQVIRMTFDKYRSDSILEENGGPEASITDAFMFAINNTYKSFMTFNAMQHTNDVFNTVQMWSNFGILATGTNTRKEDLLNDLYMEQKFASFKDKWFFETVLWFAKSAFNFDGMHTSVSNDAIKAITKLAMDDPKLKSLINGGDIGKDYMLEDLIGRNSMTITEQEKFALENIWKDLVVYNRLNDLDEKWNKVTTNSSTGKKDIKDIHFDMVEKQLLELQSKTGKTFEDLFNVNTAKSREDLKTIAVLSNATNIATPTLIQVVLYKKQQEEIKRAKERLGTKDSKIISERLEPLIQRKVLLENQHLLNLDKTAVWNVIEQDMKKNKWPMLDQYQKEFGTRFMQEWIFDYLSADYTVHKVMKNGDSSVASLMSRFALAYKSLPANETSVKIMLKHLKEVQDLPYMDWKTKLANQAAIIMGSNKALYGLLQNENKFQELTHDSQKLVSNWLYKVSSDSKDYDTSTIGYEFNKSAYSKSYMGSFKPKYQSSAYSGKRPNYSKQFSPVKNMMNWKEWLIDSDPNKYIQRKTTPITSDFTPITFDIKQAQLPAMVEYTKFYVQEVFRGFTSRSPDNKPDGTTYTPGGWPQTKTVKMAKPKKAKWKIKQKISWRKPPKHYSKWVRPDLPFSNYEWW